jgi:hypothetical protein
MILRIGLLVALLAVAGAGRTDVDGRIKNMVRGGS